jgi:16S rRNA (guanine966-N2)-methyltransferase
MRIAGGLARGIVLKSVKNDRLRPPTGYLREAIFSSFGDCVVGSRFLDLFAGTGSYELEALSRGANSGVFVESNREVAVAIEENLAAVCRSIGAPNGGGVWIRDALRMRKKNLT